MRAELEQFVALEKARIDSHEKHEKFEMAFVHYRLHPCVLVYTCLGSGCLRMVTENSVRAENAEVPSIHEILVRSR